MTCSDSSMDDCNAGDKHKIAIIVSSDSSMDDCNACLAIVEFKPGCVQIPLWTIVTRSVTFLFASARSGSDSSMDDCNHLLLVFCFFLFPVQIPLWTIVTAPRSPAPLQTSPFRFLYGRL